MDLSLPTLHILQSFLALRSALVQTHSDDPTNKGIGEDYKPAFQNDITPVRLVLWFVIIVLEPGHTKRKSTVLSIPKTTNKL